MTMLMLLIATLFVCWWLIDHCDWMDDGDD
jgi:hypothetical protein